MRWTVGLVLGLMVLYSGYWFVSRSALERTMTGWLEERRAEGWLAEGDVEVAGFPYRFETTLSGLDLADPGTGLAWDLPQLELVAMALRPHQVLAFWPNEHVIATPHEKITVRSKKMEGSLFFRPGVALELDRVTLLMDDLFLSSDTGWTNAMAQGRIGFNALEGRARTYRLGLEATGYTPSRSVQFVLDPVGALPRDIDVLRVDAIARFDRAWDRRAVEERRPQIETLDIREIRATWGQLDLRAAGDLRLDAAGFVEGELAIKAQNWREILTLMINAGIVHRDYADTVERALEFLAQASGRTRDLDAPLTFRDGKMKFGPIPLGAAPRLRLR